MRARVQRAVVALVVVLIAYQLYSYAASALIIPPVKFANRLPGTSFRSRAVRSFAGLFPPGSWELGSPKVVETDQGTLLFDEYHPYPDGRIKLDRCTLICNVHSLGSETDDAGGSEAPRPLILRAPSGATVDFDGDLSLLRGRFGRVVGGRLDGEIKILSPPSFPGAGDGLEIVTRGIQIDRQRIWTPHAVTFRYGPNRGAGRVLSIELQAQEAGTQQANDALTRGRIKSVELVHLDHLELQAAGDLFASLEARAETAQQPSDQAGQGSVEVRCRGPLRFDAQRQIITLSQQVDLVRHNPVGPSDQLNCERLEIHLYRRLHGGGADDLGASQATDESRLPAKRIVARGFPVMVRIPSRGATVRAEDMEYEFERRRLWLKDRQQVKLTLPTLTVVAPELEYELPLQGHLGRLWSSGPGTLHKHPVAGNDPVDVAWLHEVRMVPQAAEHILSVVGATVTVHSANVSADELHVYLSEQPEVQAANGDTIRLQRLRAKGKVRVQTPRLVGAVTEAKIWFVKSAPGSAPASTARRGPARAGHSLGMTSAEPQSTYQFSGDVLHAQIALAEQPELVQLSVNGRVRLTDRPLHSEPPTVFSGDRLELRRAGLARQFDGELTGQPAQGTVRGMSFASPQIVFSQRDNRLQLAGAGSMELPQAAQTGSLPSGLWPIRIQWAGGMTFDGQRARFEQDISVAGSFPEDQGDNYQFTAKGELLDVTMTRRVSFVDQSSGAPVDVRELRFPGSVFLEAKRLDRGGTQQSHTQMNARDLRVDKISGDIHAKGPGWIMHRGRDYGFMGGTVDGNAGTKAELSFLRVDFSRELQGNHHAREVAFSDRIVALYGPIASWHEQLEVQTARGLGERDVLLNCQRLVVASMGSAAAALESLELQATGNATVAGQSFSGRGERISYSRSKDQLILTGDGRADANLRFQQRPGAPPMELNTFQVVFNPGSKNFKFKRIQSFEAQIPSTSDGVRGVGRNLGPRRGYVPPN